MELSEWKILSSSACVYIHFLIYGAHQTKCTIATLCKQIRVEILRKRISLPTHSYVFPAVLLWRLTCRNMARVHQGQNHWPLLGGLSVRGQNVSPPLLMSYRPPRMNENYRRLILALVCGRIFLLKKVFSVIFGIFFNLNSSKDRKCYFGNFLNCFSRWKLIFIRYDKRSWQVLETMSHARKQPKKIGRNWTYICLKSFTTARLTE